MIFENTDFSILDYLSDQGSNFMSHLFQQVMHELNIKQFQSSGFKLLKI